MKIEFQVHGIAGNGSLVMPAPIYLGQIDVIWGTAGAGALYITEM